MRVLLFGRYGDRAGWRERKLDMPPVTLGALIGQLDGEHPELNGELRARWTLVTRNCEQVRDEETLLQADDEVAFMPPMSGG